jgi:hypothetical protein
MLTPDEQEVYDHIKAAYAGLIKLTPNYTPLLVRAETHLFELYDIFRLIVAGRVLPDFMPRAYFEKDQRSDA